MTEQDPNRLVINDHDLWVEESFAIIERRSDWTTTNPTTHFLVSREQVHLEKFLERLRQHLGQKHKLLPDIELDIEPDYLGFRGREIYGQIYRTINERGVPTQATDIQLVTTNDISGCFADDRMTYGRATHDFIQIPWEGNEKDPSPLHPLFHSDPNFPKVILLMHLGDAAGIEAFENGIRDIGSGQFKDGTWFVDGMPI